MDTQGYTTLCVHNLYIMLMLLRQDIILLSAFLKVKHRKKEPGIFSRLTLRPNSYNPEYCHL